MVSVTPTGERRRMATIEVERPERSPDHQLAFLDLGHSEDGHADDGAHHGELMVQGCGVQREFQPAGWRVYSLYSLVQITVYANLEGAMDSDRPRQVRLGAAPVWWPVTRARRSVGPGEIGSSWVET